MYTPNNGSLKYLIKKLSELKGEVENSKFIVEDFNNFFSVIVGTNRQKIRKHKSDLNNTANQVICILGHSIK